MPILLQRSLAAVAALAGWLILVLGLGFLAEALGDWTDANPGYRVLAWLAWNVTMVGLIAAAIWRWRKYRSRLQERVVATPGD